MDAFEEKATEMEKRFIQRGYKKTVLHNAKNKVRNLERHSLLKSGRPRQSSERVFFPLDLAQKHTTLRLLSKRIGVYYNVMPL